MKEWFLANFDASVIVTVCTAVGGIATAIISLVNSARSQKKLNRLLENAKRRKTQMICPKCGKSSDLDEVHFVLPDGKFDDNLNGIADDTETAE